MSTIHINLIPADRLIQKQTKRLKRRWSECLLVLAVLFAVCGFTLHANHQQSQNKPTQIKALESQNTQLTQTLAQARQQHQSQLMHQATIQLVTQRPNWQGLFLILNEATPSNVVIDSLHVTPTHTNEHGIPTRYLVPITGRALHHRDVTQMAIALEKAGCFESIDIKQTQPLKPAISLKVPGVSFSIQAVLEDGH